MNVHLIHEILSGLMFLWLAFLWSSVGGNNALIKTAYTLMAVFSGYLILVHLGIIPDAILMNHHPHPQ